MSEEDPDPSGTEPPAAVTSAVPSQTPYFVTKLPGLNPFSGFDRFRELPRERLFRKTNFPEASREQWNDWRWQSRYRFTRRETLEKVLRLSEDERQALDVIADRLPTGITPYYLSLIAPDDLDDPIRKTVVPRTAELLHSAGEELDPLGEDGHMAVPGVVHRYPDRVLFLVLDFCSTYCRYCTRSRVVGHGEITPSTERLEAGIRYIEEHSEIRDVLLSGGDPLALSDERLAWILERLRRIPHVEFLRIGSKMPAVLPQRITPQLTRMLRRFHPLWMSLHFMHPRECTPASYRACGRLADAGIPLGAQIVLAKDVNDDVVTMRELVHHLLRMRVRPYYLYQCDPISGSSHFRTPVSKGLEIIRGLRGHTTGYAVPTFVIDAPGGGGKIPLLPSSVLHAEEGSLVLENYEGRLFHYPDPGLQPSVAGGSMADDNVPSASSEVE